MVFGLLGWGIQSGRLTLMTPEFSEKTSAATAQALEKGVVPDSQKREASVDPKPRAEFQQYAASVLNGLPKLTDLQGLPQSEIHGTPPLLQEAAVELARIATLLESKGELKSEGLRFYQACSLGQDLATPVRALCLNRALRLFTELHHELWNYDREKIPDRVLELAKRL